MNRIQSIKGTKSYHRKPKEITQLHPLLLVHFSSFRLGSSDSFRTVVWTTSRIASSETDHLMVTVQADPEVPIEADATKVLLFQAMRELLLRTACCSSGSSFV